MHLEWTGSKVVVRWPSGDMAGMGRRRCGSWAAASVILLHFLQGIVLISE